MSDGRFEWVASGEVLREEPGSTPEPDPVHPPRTVLGGRFELGELLGRGGMGAVYRARDRNCGREVALKLLVRGEDATRSLLRFQREGRVAAALRHPGIVSVHSAGDVDGRPFIAYELVEGARTLDKAAHGRPLAERVTLVKDAAVALAHAHAAGVVHRDVKAENLLVDAAGCVRVTDFGLARAEDTLSRITRSGAVLGTPLYMSPEALQGQELDARADVWALGVVLYLAVTGELPFQARSLVELGRLLLEASPRPLRQLVPEASGLDRVLRRCFAPLAGRYPDAAPCAADLEAWLRGELPRSRPLFGGHVPLLALATLLVAVGATAAIVERGRGPEPSREPGTTVAPPISRQLTPPSGPPAWWSSLPARRRPPERLPAGLAWGSAPGEVVNAKDRSSLRWIPPRGERAGFFIGAYEVTWAQWRAHCAEVGRRAGDASHDGRALVGDDHPAFDVTLTDARSYCAWAGLRLPRLKEWTSAAHPEGARFPWGDDPDPRRANLTGAGDPWPYTSPVGSFPRGASVDGVHDLVGNVWEWVDTEPNLIGLYPILGGAMTSPLGTEQTEVIDRRRMGSLGFRVAR